MKTFHVSMLATLGALLWSGAAMAEEPGEPAVPRARAVEDVSLSSYQGIFTGSELLGMLVGVEGKYRYRVLEVGLLAEGGGAVFMGSYSALGGLAGLAWQGDGGARLGIDMVAGQHAYTGVGRSIVFDSNPGHDVTLPFMGARARASYVFGTNRTRFEIGALGGLDSDLARTVTQVSAGTPLPEHPSTGDNGFWKGTLAVQLGVVHDAL